MKKGESKEDYKTIVTTITHLLCAGFLTTGERPMRFQPAAWVLRRWQRKFPLTGPSLCSAGSALKTRARAVLRPRLPTASALPANELAPDRDRSGAAGTGFDNGAPSNGDDHRQIWPLRSSTPRAARGACWRRGGRRGD